MLSLRFKTLLIRISQGDARYFLSNSKDQSMKLWDIRLMSSHAAIDVSRVTPYKLTRLSYEPPRGKTNNVVSEQVRHKPAQKRARSLKFRI